MIDERSVALAKMTSPEVAEALAGAEVALIPVGATEQHGPNMSLETDTAVAYQLALHTAAALHPRAVVTPPLPYGVSYHHMGFPGTMTLSGRKPRDGRWDEPASTFIVVGCLRTGSPRLLVSAVNVPVPTPSPGRGRRR